jgi:photosystem II stability/assembly factor-like uncharacterized protein
MVRGSTGRAWAAGLLVVLGSGCGDAPCDTSRRLQLTREDSATSETLLAVTRMGSPPDTCYLRRAIAVGVRGTVVRRDEQGHWSTGVSGTDVDLRGVATYFGSSDLAAVAVGDVGTIVRTADDGATWTRVGSGTTATLRAVQFTSDGRGAAIVGDGVALVSKDLGVTWAAAQLPAGTGTLLALDSFFGSFVAVGRAGAVLTSDDGTVWTTEPAFTTADLWDVAIWSPDDTQAWIAAAADGNLYSDDGSVWTRPAGGTVRNMYNWAFPWLVDDRGALRTVPEWDAHGRYHDVDVVAQDPTAVFLAVSGECSAAAVGEGGVVALVEMTSNAEEHPRCDALPDGGPRAY